MTAVLLVVFMAVLIPAVALGVDTASFAYERSRTQNSADTGALAVAQDCALNNPTSNKCSDYQITADGFATKNAPDYLKVDVNPSGSDLKQSTGHVTVSVEKLAKTNFSWFPGLGPVKVSARATAVWNHATSGTVLPFVVSLCEYEKVPAGTATFLPADMNDVAKASFGNKPESALDPYLLNNNCSVPADVVTNPAIQTPLNMLKGGLWLDTTGGNNVCNGKVELLIFQIPPDARAANEGCTKKYSPDIASAADGILLLAIYAPTVNSSHSGLITSGGKAGNPARFGVQIVGFAPFKVTHWCLGQPAACSSGYNGPLGIGGHFITTTKPLPLATYGTTGGNFGANEIKLTQ